MRLEELCVGGEQAGIQLFLNARQIDFGVFGIRMVYVDQQRREGEQEQNSCILPLHHEENLVLGMKANRRSYILGQIAFKLHEIPE